MDQTPLKKPQFFFTTAPMPCPYLDGRMERKVVTDLSGSWARKRRTTRCRAPGSGAATPSPTLRPARAVTPVFRCASRSTDFVLRGTLRRIWKTNTDLSIGLRPPTATAEQYQVFARYQQARHGDSDMAMMGFFDYRSMVEDSPIDTCVAEVRDSQRHASGRLPAGPHGRWPVGGLFVL